MSNPIAQSRHTVPALREMAKTVRAKAAEHEQEAAELRRAADEIDAMASRAAHGEAGAQPLPKVGDEGPCPSCRTQTVFDGLGWKHMDPHTPCELNPSVPASATGEDGGEA